MASGVTEKKGKTWDVTLNMLDLDQNPFITNGSFETLKDALGYIRAMATRYQLDKSTIKRN